jgi:hypothetical protein
VNGEPLTSIPCPGWALVAFLAGVVVAAIYFRSERHR